MTLCPPSFTSMSNNIENCIDLLYRCMFHGGMSTFLPLQKAQIINAAEPTTFNWIEFEFELYLNWTVCEIEGTFASSTWMLTNLKDAHLSYCYLLVSLECNVMAWYIHTCAPVIPGHSKERTCGFIRHTIRV